MREARKKCIRYDNGGFSLIEAIIGILILAIVISPLLHALLTAANLTAKSRGYARQTAAAQDVVETILARGLDRIITEVMVPGSTMGGLVDSASLYKLSNDGIYIKLSDDELDAVGERDDKYYLGLTGIKTEQGNYDAMVCLDADKYNANVNAVSIYTEMDGVFSQPSSNNENPDLLAAAYFSDQATVASGSEVSIDYFFGRMDRTVTITLSRIPDGDGATTGVVIGEVEFAYTCDYTPDASSETHIYNNSYDTEFFRAVYDEYDDGVDSIFFFFYPNYCNPLYPEQEGDETINVCNDDNIKFSLFIVKQKNNDYAEEDMNTMELGYSQKVSVTLFENGSTITGPPNCLLYSNLNTGIVSGNTINVGKTYKYQLRQFVEGRELKWDYKLNIIPDKLVTSKPVNRMYAVTVQLFSSEADFAQDKTLLTFKSTQIE